MKRFVIPLILLATCAITAKAWLRPAYEDATVVNRSELIVVGHLERNSIQFIPHTNTPPEGRSWEDRAILIISEVIKGKSTNDAIPIIIHYGLTPIIGGYLKEDGFIMVDLRGGKKDYPTNLVEIIDTGSGVRRLMVGDVSKDNIWFLRRLGGDLGREPSPPNDLGVLDPEDIQPLNLKGYFQAYLSDDPETEVKVYAAKHPEVGQRAQRWSDHLEIQRIVKIEDPATRLAALLPHYLSDQIRWPEIRQGIVSCGKIAGEKLVSVFQDPNHKELRQNIILIWRDLGYTNAAPLLIPILLDGDRFWAEQKLTNGWWNSDVTSALTEKRREIYGEIYYSVAALRKFRDPSSKNAIELTKKRWESIQFDNPQILEECDGALKELSNGE